MAPTRRKATTAPRAPARRRPRSGQTATLEADGTQQDDEDELAIKPGEFVVEMPVVKQRDQVNRQAQSEHRVMQARTAIHAPEDDDVVLPSDEEELQALTFEMGEEWVKRVQARRTSRAVADPVQRMNGDPNTLIPADRRQEAWTDANAQLTGTVAIDQSSRPQRPHLELSDLDAFVHEPLATTISEPSAQMTNIALAELQRLPPGGLERELHDASARLSPSGSEAIDPDVSGIAASAALGEGQRESTTMPLPGLVRHSELSSDMQAAARTLQSDNAESQDPLDFLPSPSTTRTIRREPSQRSRHRSATPTSVPTTLANMAPRRESQPSSLGVPQASSSPARVSPPPLDPALYAFQAARTFRKRTAIQLQPYTREKLKYTETVRRGGRQLIRELMHDDPDKAALKAQEAQQDSQFVEDASIDQDESLVDDPESLPVQPTDDDRQEFADLHGESPDDDFDARLQAIAKARLRREAEEKRQKAKDAKLERKLRLELERKAQEKRREERAAKKLQRDRKRQARLAEMQSSLEQSRTQTAPRKKSTTESGGGVKDALARLRRLSSSSNSSLTDIDGSDGFDGFDGDFGDDGFGDLDAPIDAPHSSSTSSPLNGESLPSAVNPQKAKVLNRMLPAFMVKRLADAEKRKIAAEKAKSRMDRRLSASPQKGLGVARVRRAARQRGDSSLNGFYVEQPDEDENADAPPLNIFDDEEIPVAPVYAGLDALSDEDVSIVTVSSESEEDGTESLNLLRAGNFTRLLNGERKTPRTGPSNPKRRLLRQALEPRRRRGPLQQTRLNFNAEKPSLPRHRKRKQRTDKTTRPRVMLDDTTIFADPPALERDRRAKPSVVASRVIPPVTPGPAPLKRQRVDLPETPSTAPGRSSPAPVGMDLVVPPAHKKSSLWSDEYDFQVDFDVKPLPSGIDASLALPTADLADQLDWLVRPLPSQPVEIACEVEVSGIQLSTTMEPGELFEALRSAGEVVLSQLNDPSNEGAPFEQLHLHAILDYARQIIRQGAPAEVLNGIAAALQPVITAVEALDVRRDSGRTNANRTILHAQWGILNLLVLLERAILTRQGALGYLSSSVDRAIRRLLASMLDYGFDRTMRPLKKVMSGEALDGTITEPTVGLWIAVRHLVEVRHAYHSSGTSVLEVLDDLLQGEVGVRHCEKVWYLIFGMAAISQFGSDGKTGTGLSAKSAWHLVRTALKSISIPALTEEEELRMRPQLKRRDKYIKILVMRCLQLSCVWEWRCDEASFPIATKDLGTIFRNRHHRNLPSESSSDFPEFIVQMDLGKTDDLDYDDSAYNLYLRFICISASDMIELADSIEEAENAVKEVQRLMLAIFPSSTVSSQHVARRMTSLINRYSTVIVAALFAPSLLPWLINNASKWVDLTTADVTIRSITVRGLMYLGVVARHHAVALEPVTDRLATVFDMVAAEKSAVKADDPQHRSKNLEADRQQVLVIAAFRYVIEHHSFKRESQQQPNFPDPALLHPSWTTRLTSREMVTDRRSGHEIIDCIQAFLDARQHALVQGKQATYHTRTQEESQSSEFSAMGIDFDDEDLLALDQGALSKESLMDVEVAQILHERISPGIFEMLSNTLQETTHKALGHYDQQDQLSYIAKLTRCWVDCATILVVEHHLREWSTYMGFGRESWERLSDERGKRQVGMHFMLSIARRDPRAFVDHSDEFVLLFCQALVSEDRTIEPQYAEAVLQMPEAGEHALLSRLEFRADRFFVSRVLTLRGLFANIFRVLSSPGPGKPLGYRCANVTVATMLSNYEGIPEMARERRVEYAAFCNDTVGLLRREAGTLLTEQAVPKLKAFPLRP